PATCCLLPQRTANRVIQDASRPLKRLSGVAIVLLLHLSKDFSQLIAAFAKRLGLFATHLDPIRRRPRLGRVDGPEGSQAQRPPRVVAGCPRLPPFSGWLRNRQPIPGGRRLQFHRDPSSRALSSCRPP